MNFEKKAKTQIAQIVKNGWDKLPICMAKTQYSFSDNPNALGAPENFEITIREVVPKLGAGFIVAFDWGHNKKLQTSYNIGVQANCKTKGVKTMAQKLTVYHIQNGCVSTTLYLHLSIDEK